MSQLDTVDQPYLLTEDATDEDDFPPREVIETLDLEDNKGQPVTAVENDSAANLVPSEEAQHLVNALDSMISDQPQHSSSDDNSVALDELDALLAEESIAEPSITEASFTEQAIEIDDDLLKSSMAEFDESQVVGDSTLSDIDATDKAEQSDLLTDKTSESNVVSAKDEKIAFA